MKSPLSSNKELGFPLLITLSSLFILSILVILALVTLYGKNLQNKKVQEVQEASNRIFAAMALSSLEPVINEDVASLQKLLDLFVEEVPEIQSIAVSNEDDLTLIKREKLMSPIRSNTKTFTKKITSQGELFGEITITWDIENQQREIQNNIIKFGFMICLSLVFVTIFFVLFLRFFIVKPVFEIRNRILAISQGDLTSHLQVSGVRELRLLQNTINNLCQGLQKEQDQKIELLTAKDKADEELIRSRKIEKERENLHAELLRAQKMESIGFLAGGIAHEFNNILSVVLGNNELILLKVPEFSALYDHSEKINDAALRAKEIVKQLLTFSRQDSMVKGLINTRLVVHDALKLIGVTIPANIAFKHHLEDQVHPILGNATQIHQLLINLCKNAADASDIPGGEISISLCNLTISEENKAIFPNTSSGDYVKLTVQDNGSGIGEDMQNNIFDPFFTTKGIGEGSGIGLAIVHGVVTGHGGSITIDSEEGKGTTFTILFPAQKGQPQTKIEPTEELLSGKENIIVVEDEESICESIQNHLSRLGYNVEAFTDPTEALERCRKTNNPFDLVISDMAMPKMTGAQLSAEILKISPKTPIILCTGYSSAITKESAEEIGIKAFLMKPVKIAELLKIARTLLNDIKN